MARAKTAAPAAPEGSTPWVVVTVARKQWRYRAGRFWPQGETRLAQAELDDDQLQALNDDPVLSVALVAEAEAQ